MRDRILILCSVCCFTVVPAWSQSVVHNSLGFETVAAADDELGSTMTLADLQKTKGKTKRHREAKPLDVEPAAEPVPALRLRLYPAKWELKPGQALLHFTRAQLLFAQQPKEKRMLWQSAEWLDLNSEGPVPTDDELKAVVNSLQTVFRELHELAQAEDFRWDHRLRDIRGPQVYMYLLPDVQEVRSLARILVLKIRHQLNQKDFDGAIASIGDGLRLAEFVGQGETLIQKLVGIAVAAIMRTSLYEAISTPGCPNLYWALATVPRPLVEMRDSVLWELTNITNVLPVLAEAETEIWTDAEAAKKWSATLEDLGALSGIDPSHSNLRIALAISSVTFIERARQQLRTAGFPKERLDQMPGLQVVLLDASRELQRVGDALGKAHLLPPPLARSLFQREDQKYRLWLSENRMASVAAVISGLLYPAVSQAQEAETRTVMSYNRLMTLEALRMHAAENNGSLPDALDELQPVPAIPDPYTGKPFGYQVEVVDGQSQVTLTAEGPRNYKPLLTLRARFSK